MIKAYVDFHKKAFKFVKKNWRVVLSVTIAIVAPYALYGVWNVAALSVSQAIFVGVVAGGVSGLVTTGSLTGALKGAIFGTVGAGVGIGIAKSGIGHSIGGAVGKVFNLGEKRNRNNTKPYQLRFFWWHSHQTTGR